MGSQPAGGAVGQRALGISQGWMTYYCTPQLLKLALGTWKVRGIMEFTCNMQLVSDSKRWCCMK